MIVEATHIQLVLVVINPDHVEAFFRHYKTDPAYMINGLLGRTKRTLWCDGYDSPTVLTPTRALRAIAYLYSNPAKDNLETSIDRYPGLSSWNMFRSGNLTRQWKWLRRPHLTPIRRDANNLRGYTKRAEEIIEASDEVQTFPLQPNAWMETFGYHSPEQQQRMNEQLIARIRSLEERAERKRVREKKRVFGRDRLISQVFDTTYRPRRKGRRMWCLSEKRSVRIDFIRFLGALMQKARAVREKWKLGEVAVPYPPGLYPPSMPKLANAHGR